MINTRSWSKVEVGVPEIFSIQFINNTIRFMINDLENQVFVLSDYNAWKTIIIRSNYYQYLNRFNSTSFYILKSSIPIYDTDLKIQGAAESLSKKAFIGINSPKLLDHQKYNFEISTSSNSSAIIYTMWFSIYFWENLKFDRYYVKTLAHRYLGIAILNTIITKLFQDV